MNPFDAITGYRSYTYNGRIITYGLTDEENSYLKILMRTKNYEIYDADIVSDLIAIFANAIIVNAAKLELDDFELLENYYSEVKNEADEIVFWLNSPKPSIELQMLFKCSDSFDELISSLINLIPEI